MRWKYGLIITVAGFGAWLWFKENGARDLLIVNKHIDICADDTSGRYNPANPFCDEWREEQRDY